jgi:hypothetical protein
VTEKKKAGLSKQEFREGLLRLLETAPSPDRKHAVILKLEQEISTEEDPDTQVELEQQVALSREAYARAAWQEFDNKQRMLDDEDAVALIGDHAQKTGLNLFDAYKDLLSPAPDEPRPVTYSDQVVPSQPKGEV